MVNYLPQLPLIIVYLVGIILSLQQYNRTDKQTTSPYGERGGLFRLVYTPPQEGGNPSSSLSRFFSSSNSSSSFGRSATIFAALAWKRTSPRGCGLEDFDRSVMH
jgi:hypothetical protein